MLRMESMHSGLRLALVWESWGENVQTESKTCRLLAEMSLSAVRKNPQEPARTRRNPRKHAVASKKNQLANQLVFQYGAQGLHRRRLQGLAALVHQHCRKLITANTRPNDTQFAPARTRSITAYDPGISRYG